MFPPHLYVQREGNQHKAWPSQWPRLPSAINALSVFRKASVWVMHQACKEPVSGYCCCSSWVIIQALVTKAFLLCSVHPFTRCIGPFKASFCLLKPRSCWTDLLDDWLIFPFAGYKCDHKCESMDWCEWNGTDSVLVLSLSLSLPHVHQSLFLLFLSRFTSGQWSCPVEMMCSAICSILKKCEEECSSVSCFQRQD